jgi:hypothetical protein
MEKEVKVSEEHVWVGAEGSMSIWDSPTTQAELGTVIQELPTLATKSGGSLRQLGRFPPFTKDIPYPGPFWRSIRTRGSSVSSTKTRTTRVGLLCTIEDDSETTHSWTWTSIIIRLRTKRNPVFSLTGFLCYLQVCFWLMWRDCRRVTAMTHCSSPP